MLSTTMTILVLDNQSYRHVAFECGFLLTFRCIGCSLHQRIGDLGGECFLGATSRGDIFGQQVMTEPLRRTLDYF